MAMGQQKKGSQGFCGTVYDDDMNVEEETDSDSKSWGMGSWGVLDSDEDRGSTKTSCKTSLSDCSVMNSGALGGRGLAVRKATTEGSLSGVGGGRGRRDIALRVVLC